MKRGILFYLLAFSAACLTGGELVPLQQYRKSVFRINPVPDRYLFEATAILAASEFFKGDETGFQNRFSQLPVMEQYHAAYVLSAWKDDDRMREVFIPVYNVIRRRLKEKDFDAELSERFARVWRNFIQDLEIDPDRTGEFYEYARRAVASCRSDAPENEQLYLAQMLSIASYRRLEHVGAAERDEIVKFVTDMINRTTSNQVKTRLTYDFIHYMKKGQLEALNTTEYALLLALPKLLHYGRFPEFAGIYCELFKKGKEYVPENEILEELQRYFPGEKWNSPQEAVEVVDKNRASFVFDEGSRWYIRR